MFQSKHKHQAVPTQGTALDEDYHDEDGGFNADADAVIVDVDASSPSTMAKGPVVPMEMDDEAANDEMAVVGVLQEPAYRDKWWAVAFCLHLLAVGAVAMFLPWDTNGDSAAAGGADSSTIQQEGGVEANPNGDFSQDLDDMFKSETASDDPGSYELTFALGLMFAGVVAVSAVVLSLLSLVVMYRKPLESVKAAFIASPVIFGFFGLIMVATAGDDGVQGFFGVMWIVSAIMTVCFAFIYWKYLSFAASNLKTALTAIQQHAGVFFVAFGVVLIGGAFSAVWIVALVGVFSNAPSDNDTSCNSSSSAYNGNSWNDDRTNQGQQQCAQDWTPVYFIALMLSYYWTHYTLQAITRVTVAGVVGEWFFEPANPNQRASCCSSAVRGALSRSLTYSFGSICMGSLIVAAVQTLRQMARNQRGRRGNILCCVIECILACLKNILEYLNDWAFVYVGLYGYGFVDAAKNVFGLFRTRGWSTIIGNGLVVRTLLLVILLIGASTGLVSLLTGFLLFGELDSVTYGFGVVVGIILSSIVLTVVDGAVKTSIVCFAEAPRDFRSNHPELHREMTQAYASAYPDVFVTIATPIDNTIGLTPTVQATTLT